MNNDLTRVIRSIGFKWNDYFQIINKYNEQYGLTAVNPTEYSHTMYKLWCEASSVFAEYTKAIREFTNALTWDQTVTVGTSGEIVGISAPGCSMIFINAFVSSYDNAIARYGSDNKIFVRLGGLPISTVIHTQSGMFIVDETGMIVPYVRPMGASPLKLINGAT